MVDLVNSLGFGRCVSKASLRVVENALEQQGYVIFQLDGQLVSEKHTFFETAKNILPFDPPLGLGYEWDAFIDSLALGLSAADLTQVAILWLDPENMINNGLQDFLMAVLCCFRVATEVSDSRSGIPKMIKMKFLLFGQGVNFKPID